MATKRRAVVIFNLGGPDNSQAIQPFLFNLFYDPAIISLPNPLRWLVARLISGRRVAEATEIYDQIGGGSPIVPETQKQAEALTIALNDRDADYEHRVFIAMRYWHPFVAEAAADVAAWQPDEIVLLPLYPQFSTTTTGTSFQEWDRQAESLGIDAPTRRVCCYPDQSGWVSAQLGLIREGLQQAQHQEPEKPLRLLFSAHGLPERTVERGDPYPDHVQQGVEAIVDALGIEGLDWQLCYQSRVGPLKWIGPQIDDEMARAAADGVGLVVVPIAFVSEHSETLVELDKYYGQMAAETGIAPYVRVPAVGIVPAFIDGLADMVMADLGAVASASGARQCSAACITCPMAG